MRNEVERIGFLLYWALGLLVLGGALRAADCGVGVAPCGCGDTVVRNYTLAADLVCPATFSGDALTIGADGITIDGLGMYRIEAPMASAVIQNSLHSGWTLRNIAIKGGFFGIQSDGRARPMGVHGIMILDVDASSSQGLGQRIRFIHTHQSHVERSQADGGDIGIYNLNGNDNYYVDTSASWLPDYGPLPPDTGGAGQNQVCIQLIGAHDNILERMTANGRRLAVDILGDTTNPGWGFRASDRNIVRDSQLSGNGGGISFGIEGDGNQYLRNDLSFSALSSIDEPSGSINLALQVNGDSGVVIEGNTYDGSFNGISLSNIDAGNRALAVGADLSSLTGNYGLRLANAHHGRYEQLVIGAGTRQSLWWTAGSSGNTFHQITAQGHTFGLLSQGAHGNLVTASEFSWPGPGREATGIDLREGSSDNFFEDITVHGRQTGAQITQGGRGTTLQNSDLAGNHNCILAVTNDPIAWQRFYNLDLTGCTGNAMRVGFDELFEVRDIDFSNSSVGLSLFEMSGIALDGQAQGLNLTDVANSGLLLSNVHDSIFTNLTVGGSWHAVHLTTSSGNLFAGIEAPWNGPTATGNGFLLDRSAQNTIRDSAIKNRDVGLQILSGSNRNEVVCNLLRDNRIGVLNHLGAENNGLRLNLIAGNAAFGVRNTDSRLLAAAENYWGRPDGPSPPGSGDAISGPVVASPYFSTARELRQACGQ